MGRRWGKKIELGWVGRGGPGQEGCRLGRSGQKIGLGRAGFGLGSWDRDLGRLGFGPGLGWPGRLLGLEKFGRAIRSARPSGHL